MSALNGADHDAVLRAVAAVHATAHRDEFASVALREISALVGSQVSSLNEVDPAADRLVYLSHPADYPMDADGARVFARLAPTHPLIRYYAETGDGSAMRVSDLWTPEQWHSSPLFAEFYRPLRVEHQMAITLPAPLPIVVAIAVNRLDGQPDFDERERALLDAVRPHLAQAWRRARDQERVAALVSAASTALVASGALVIVLAVPPHELTPGAFTALYRFFGRPGRDDPLPARVRRWLDEQRAASTAGPALTRPLHASRDGRQVIVRHLPGGRPNADVLLLDERPDLTSRPTLHDAGLTDRECDVIALVSGGASNAAVAAELSLSPWTVKRHLANIYTKLGVRSRTAAVAVALDMTGHHGRPD